MKINFTAPTSFGTLPMRKINDICFPKDFQCLSNNKVKYDVTIGNNYGTYQIYFNDGIEREEANAEQEIILNKDNNHLYVDNMFTQDEFRGEGLGVCMHLTNIIEMLENGLTKIELYAVSTAIPFHSKCGFKPNDKWVYTPVSNMQKINTMQENLRCIKNDKTPELSEFSDAAKDILRSFMNIERKSKITNKILYNYIKKALKIKPKEELQTMFKYPMNMVLTKEDVIKNKKFYNKLFKKYNIDYQIQ